MKWTLLHSEALTYGQHSSCMLSFIHSFTNHILSEAASCWSRDKQHLADSVHLTDIAEQMHGNEDTHSSLKVMISKRNKQLIKK